MNKKINLLVGGIAVVCLSAAMLIGVKGLDKPEKNKVSVPTESSQSTSQTAKVETPVSSQKDIVWGQQLGTSAEDLTVAIAVDGLGNNCTVGYTLGDVVGKNKGNKDLLILNQDSEGKKLWVLQTGTDASDVANGVVYDAQGDIYITGNTLGNFGNTSEVGRVFIQKISKEGKVLWTKQYGPDKRATSNAIKIDKEGNLFISGSTEGQMGEAVFGVSDAFLMKLDKEGEILWTCQWGTESTDEVKGIDLDKAGNIYAMGNTYGTMGEANFGQMDIFLSQISPEGKLNFSKQYGSPSNETGTKVLVDADNNCYLTGWTDGDFADKQLGAGDAMLLKVSATGDVLWKKQFGTDLWDGIHSIVQSKSNPKDIIVGGCQNYSNCQAFLRKFDADGNEIWKKELIPAFSTCGREIGIDDQGFIYQTGGTHGQLFGTDAFAGAESDVFVYKISE